MCIATRDGFGIGRHILHRWKRLGVGRNNKLEMGQFCRAQEGQSGGRVNTLSGEGEAVVFLKARVGESSGDIVGILYERQGDIGGRK